VVTRIALLIAALATLVSGCQGEIDLLVDLKTDLRPGLEFDQVRTELLTEVPSGGSVVGARLVEQPAIPEADYIVGQRVAELSGVAAGQWVVRVQLHGSGTLVAERIVQLELDSPYAVTVVVTRDCRGVTCPGAGDDAVAVTCLGGRCVPPTCEMPSDEDCGPPACAISRDCPTPAAACASPRCDEGICYSLSRDADCAADEYCDPDVGCVPRVAMDGGMSDAGMDASTDSAMGDGGMDAMTTDTGPPCVCTPGESRTGGCDPDCSEETCNPDCLGYGSCDFTDGDYECDYRGGARMDRCDTTASGIDGWKYCVIGCVWSVSCCVLGSEPCNITADCCTGTCTGGTCG